MTLADLEALHATAVAVQSTHPGPWEVQWTRNLDGSERKPHRGVDRIVAAPTQPQPDWLAPGEVRREDVLIADSGVYPPHGKLAEYIGAMSPDVSTRLIAVVRALIADLDDPDGDTGVSGATWDALAAIGYKP